MRLALLLLLLGTAAADAQPAVVPDSLRSAEVPRKGYAQAYTYALTGTVVPVLAGSALADGEGGLSALGGIVMAGGLLVGPSAGRIYAGDASAIVTIGLRTAGFLSFGAGLGYLLGGTCAGSECTSYNDTLGGALVIGGSAAISSSLLLDLFLTRRAVRTHNARAVRLLVTPGFDVRSGTPRLSLRVAF
ncbi:MAG: hypothetical protein AAGI91_09235 [Bacteroidota bacterium]